VSRQICKVTEHNKVSDDIYRISLESQKIVSLCRPGQFVHIRINESFIPLLRRPFSIHRVSRQKGEFEILYRVVGCGTEMLKRVKPGENLDVMGPLGRGFSIDGDFSDCLIVAGGMGSAPVFFLIDELLERDKRIFLFWGTKTGGEIFGTSDLEKCGVKIRIATEDGSLGQKGVVTDILASFLRSLKSDSKIRGYTCGPREMLKKVQNITAKSAVEWEASVEERMACGIGACQGCCIKSAGGGYRLVCLDGPVFNLREIEFND